MLPRALILGFLAIVALGAGLQLWSSSGSDGNSDEGVGQDLPTGPAEALGVAVQFPVVDLGRVPLNTPAGGQWLLRNDGSTPVTVGRPAIEVLDGC